jgi:hypothetical protein
MVTGELFECEGKFVVVISKENVAQLGVRAGDQLKIDKLLEDFSAEGVSAPRTEASETLEIARQVIAENREALRELAK